MVKFDGTDGTRDLRIRDNKQKGCFFRHSCELEDTKFVQGIYDRPHVDEEDVE